MSQSEPWTIQRLLNWTTNYFREREFDSARLDAEVLLAHALQCERIQLYAQFDTEPEPQVLTQFREWVKRRASGEPVAYLVGHKEFYSLEFAVDHHVLIPRPETEHLITETIDRFKEHSEGNRLRIVDVGTGSGAIAITLAKHLLHAEISAIDISGTAIAIAKKNAQHHQVSDRIQFIQSDLFDSIAPGVFFDAVVSNPPYIGEKERDEISDEVKNYEPGVALFSTDQEGIEVTARLIDQSISRLNPSGWLLFETSPMLAQRCLELVKQTGQFEKVSVITDFAKRERIVVAQKCQ